jgi:hypothetical protein
MNRLCVLTVLLVSASAYLSGQDEPKPAAAVGTATIVFYRYRAYVGSARRATANVDEKQICSLANGRYFKTEVPACTHLITGPDKRKGEEVTFEAGKTYYFRAVLNVTGAFQIHNVFTVIPVPPEQGQFEIKSLKELDPSDVNRPTEKKVRTW